LRKRGISVLLIVTIFLLANSQSVVSVPCCDDGGRYYGVEEVSQAICESDEDAIFHDECPSTDPEMSLECCCLTNGQELTTTKGCDTKLGDYNYGVIDEDACASTCASEMIPTVCSSSLSSCEGSLSSSCSCNGIDAQVGQYCCVNAETTYVYSSQGSCDTACNQASESYTLTGTVTSSEKDVVIEGALVEATESNEKSVITGKEGTYTLTFTELNQFLVEVSKFGFESASNSILLDLDEDENVLDFTLGIVQSVCGNLIVEAEETCETDNDCDGLNTCISPGETNGCTCKAPEAQGGQSTSENSIDLCGNGIDEDLDGYVDGCDKDCWTHLSYNYGDNEPVEGILAKTSEICDDNFDNDCDGLFNYADDECKSENEFENGCGNKVDDDGDLAIDICDSDCAGSLLEASFPKAYLPNVDTFTYKSVNLDDSEDHVGESGEELCNDRIDNDCDGKIDCFVGKSDSGCNCGEICSNGVDDDGDGLIDCMDSDCFQTQQKCNTADGTNCKESYSYDSDGDNSLDTCCPKEKIKNCNNGQLPDTCSSSCNKEICDDDENNDEDGIDGANCEDDACSGLRCAANKVCYKKQCVEKQGAVVTGIVVDENNELISGAKVEFYLDGTYSESKIYYVKDNGRFIFFNVEMSTDPYKLEVSYKGYHDYPYALKNDIIDFYIDGDKEYTIQLFEKVKYRLEGKVESKEGEGIEGATILIDGAFGTKTVQGGNYIVENVYEGSIFVEAKANGFEPQTKSITLDGNKQNENFELEPIHCGRDRPKPRLEINIIENKPQVDLTWGYDCLPMNISLSKCYDDSVENPNVCDTNLIPIEEFNSNVLEYTDTEIEGGIEYCYTVNAKYDDDEYAGIVSSEQVCVGPFHDSCLKQSGRFCDDNKVWQCNGNKKANAAVQDCNKISGLKCLGPTSEGDAFCSYQSDCSTCSSPLGLFASPEVSTKVSYFLQTNEVSEACENIPLCYYDSTYSSVDTYYPCSGVTSCYNYQSKRACEGNPNLKQDGDIDGKYNNRCLNRNCQWNADPRYDELGGGVCEEVEKEDNCNLCTQPGLNDVYGVCDKTRCGLYGSCYCDNMDENGICGSCTAKTEIGCEDYDTEQDCTGGEELDVDVIWSEELKVSGTHEFLNPSKDSLDIGRCKWNKEEEYCYKDSDNYKRDCSDTDRDCVLDQKSPTTYYDSSKVYCHGANCTRNPSLELFIKDDLPSINEFVTYYTIFKDTKGINEEPSQVSYPKQLVEGKFDLEFDKIVDEYKDGIYTVYMFSEDDSSNLEYPIDFFKVRMDTKEAAFTVEATDVNIYTKKFGNAEYKYSEVTFDINLVDGPGYCSADLYKAGSDQIWDSLKIENEFGESFKRKYEDLADGTYYYDVTCEDAAGNTYNKILETRTEADRRIRNAKPYTNIHTSEAILSVDTTANVDCRYYDDLTIEEYDSSFGTLLQKNIILEEDLDDIVDFYRHTSDQLDLESDTYKYKVICNDENNPFKEILFTVDDKSPTTQVLVPGTDEVYNLGDWKEAHEFELKCVDEKFNSKNYNHLGELGGFGCDKINYCFGVDCEPDLVFELPININEGDEICYQSVDKGENLENKICTAVNVDNTPALISISLNELGKTEVPIVLRNNKYFVTLTSDEDLKEVKLSYEVFGASASSDIILTSTNPKLWKGSFEVPLTTNFDDIEGDANFVLSAFDLHGVESTIEQVDQIKSFEIDTKGPPAPSIFYPTGNQNQPSNKITVLGFAHEEQSNFKIRTYYTTENFKDQYDASISNAWDFIETTSFSENSVVDTVELQRSIDSGNLIYLKGNKANFEGYIDLPGHDLTDKSYYKIESNEANDEFTVLTIFPPLIKGVDENKLVNLHSKQYPTGWFSAEVPLLIGKNYLYSVELDQYGNLGTKTDYYEIVSDPNPPIITIDAPPAKVSAIAPELIKATIFEEDSLLDLSSLKIELKSRRSGENEVFTQEFKCSDEELKCTDQFGGTLEETERKAILTLTKEFPVSIYEYTVYATDTVGSLGEESNWFEVDAEVPHNPIIDLEPGITVNRIGFTNVANPIINLNFLDDMGKTVTITKLTLQDENKNFIDVSYVAEEVIPSFDTITTFIQGDEATLNLNSEDYDLSFKILQDVEITNAQFKVTGLMNNDAYAKKPWVNFGTDIVYDFITNDVAFNGEVFRDFTTNLNTLLSNCEIDDEGMCTIPVSIGDGFGNLIDAPGALKISDLIISYEPNENAKKRNTYTRYNLPLTGDLIESKYFINITANKETDDGQSKDTIVDASFIYTTEPAKLNIIMDNPTMDLSPKFRLESNLPIKCGYTLDDKEEFNTGNEYFLNFDSEPLPERKITHLNVKEKAGIEGNVPNEYIENPKYLDANHTLNFKCEGVFNGELEKEYTYQLVHPKQNRLFYGDGDTIVFQFFLEEGTSKSLIGADLSNLDSTFSSDKYITWEEDGVYYLSYEIDEDNEHQDGWKFIYLTYPGAVREKVVVHLKNTFTNVDLENSISCNSKPGYFFNEENCPYDFDVQNMYAFNKEFGNEEFNEEGFDCEGENAVNTRACASIYYKIRNLKDFQQSIVLDDPCYNDQFCMFKIRDLGVTGFYNKYASTTGNLKVRFEMSNSNTVKNNFQVYDFTGTFGQSTFTNCEGGEFIKSDISGEIKCATPENIRALMNLKIIEAIEGENKPKVQVITDVEGNNRQAVTELELFEIRNNKKASLVNSEALLNNGVYSYCNDGVDNDLDSPFEFDKYGGDKADCRDDDCNGLIVNNLGNKCELNTELSCNDGFDNDMDDPLILKSSGYAQLIEDYQDGTFISPKGRFLDCFDTDCFKQAGSKVTAEACLVKETNCNNGNNDDFDFGKYGQPRISKSYQDLSDGIALTDCLDVDCDGRSGFANCKITGGCLCEYSIDTTVDSDNDGIPDVQDDDLDGDGTKNGNDPDADNDGEVDDNYKDIVSDPDIDNDGLLNVNDEDIDGDGIENGDDPDANGDGVVDDKYKDVVIDVEKDTDGDGIVDINDKDIDNDGILNGDDPDANGDGIVDDRYKDVVPDKTVDTDNDGKLDINDEDIDNDGILNDDDPDANGDGIVDNRYKDIIKDVEKDTDGDGNLDINDDDIDGDGILNGNDPDANEDGEIDTQYEDIVDDPDTDNDGILDIDDNDIDGDGIENKHDPDANGDGIVDLRYDDIVFDSITDTDGDGTVDIDDEDIDNDGILNGDDPDANGDGRVDKKYENIVLNPLGDNDGDGKLNINDGDIDGDGINNSDDLTPVGPLGEGKNYPSSCKDEFDNDADGSVDCYDAGSCWGAGGRSDNEITNPCPAFENNNPAWCHNGKDDDFDDGAGNLDRDESSGMDCEDYDCRGIEADTIDGKRTCPVTEGQTKSFGFDAAQCFDGKDNDLDAPDKVYSGGSTANGIDCRDVDCNGVTKPNTEQSCEFEKEVSCDDGFDNDGNGFCDYLGCNGLPPDPACTTGNCYPSPITESITLDSCMASPSYLATGNEDAAVDNVANCADSDCDGQICGIGSTCKNNNCETSLNEVCNNGLDDDNDGLKDCQDSDCTSDCPNTDLTGLTLPDEVWEYNDDLSFGGSFGKVEEGTVIASYNKYVKKGDFFKLNLKGTEELGMTFFVGDDQNPLSNLNDNFNLDSNSNKQDSVSYTVKTYGGQIEPFTDNARVKIDSTFAYKATTVGQSRINLIGRVGTDQEKISTLNIKVLENVAPEFEELIVSTNPEGALITALASDSGTGIYYCNFRMYDKTTDNLITQNEHNTDCIWDYQDGLDSGIYYVEVDVFDGAGNSDSETGYDISRTFVKEGPSLSSIDGLYSTRKYFNKYKRDDLEVTMTFESDNGFNEGKCIVDISDVNNVKTDGGQFDLTLLDNNKAECKVDLPLNGYDDSLYDFAVSVTDAGGNRIITKRNPFWVCNFLRTPEGIYRCRDECTQQGLNVDIIAPVEGEVFEYPLINVKGTAPPNVILKAYVNNEYTARLQSQAKSTGDFNFNLLALSRGQNTITVLAVDELTYNTGEDSVMVIYNSEGPVVNINIEVTDSYEQAIVTFSIFDDDQDGLPDAWEDLKGLDKTYYDSNNKYNSTHTWMQYYLLTDALDIENSIFNFTRLDNIKTDEVNEEMRIDVSTTSDGNVMTANLPILEVGDYSIGVISIDQEGEAGETEFIKFHYDPLAPRPYLDPIPPSITKNESYEFRGYVTSVVPISKVELTLANSPNFKSELLTLDENNKFAHNIYLFNDENKETTFNDYEVLAYNGERYNDKTGLIIHDEKFRGVESARLVSAKERKADANIGISFEQY